MTDRQLKVLVIGNFSDRRCGFQNFSLQTVTALRRAGHDVTAFDGTYSQVYARLQDAVTHPYAFLPADMHRYDVIHVIWHPATLNHYSGAAWPVGPTLSVWNGCPAAWCPFNDLMHVKWGVLGKEAGHRQLWYPIPDWVEDLPEPAAAFTVGYSGVRREGVELLTDLCRDRGWAMNFSEPDRWLTQEEEIQRLARSTVNVCWYGAVHDDRSGSVMVCLASRRPLLTNTVRMFDHLIPYADEIYRSDDLTEALDYVATHAATLTPPRRVLDEMSWTRAVQGLEAGWLEARR